MIIKFWNCVSRMLASFIWSNKSVEFLAVFINANQDCCRNFRKKNFSWKKTRQKVTAHNFAKKITYFLKKILNKIVFYSTRAFLKIFSKTYSSRSGICINATPRNIPTYPPMFPNNARPSKARTCTISMNDFPKKRVK